MLEGREELHGGLVGGEGGTMGDVDDLGVESQSIRLYVVNCLQKCEADIGLTTSPSSV